MSKHYIIELLKLKGEEVVQDEDYLGLERDGNLVCSDLEKIEILDRDNYIIKGTFTNVPFQISELNFREAVREIDINGHLTCKKCGYKQWDEDTCLSYKIKHLDMELEDIPYTCGACAYEIVPMDFSEKEFIELTQDLGFSEEAAEEIYDFFQAEYEFNGLQLVFEPDDWEEIEGDFTDEEIDAMRVKDKVIIHRTCTGSIVKGVINQ